MKKKFYKEASKEAFKQFELHLNPTKNQILEALQYAFNDGACCGTMDSRVSKDAFEYFEKRK